jgi:hypothetical protein
MNSRLLRPTASGFNPKSISGLVLWLDLSDAANVTLDANNLISNITDKSGSGFNGSQTTAANRPGVSTMNGRQCGDWGTSSNTLRVIYAHGSNGNNWRDGFIAAAWDAGGSTFPAFSGLFTANAISGTANGAILTGNSGTANWGADGIWHRPAGSILQTNSATPVENGLTAAAFPAITSPFVVRGQAKADVGVNGWQLGCDRTLSGRGWRGRIGEVIVYNRQVTSSEALRVRRYLASKWGAPAQT